MTALAVAEVPSPVGTIVVAAHDRCLVALEFAHRWPHRLARLERVR